MNARYTKQVSPGFTWWFDQNIKVPLELIGLDGTGNAFVSWRIKPVWEWIGEVVGNDEDLREQIETEITETIIEDAREVPDEGRVLMTYWKSSKDRGDILEEVESPGGVNFEVPVEGLDETWGCWELSYGHHQYSGWDGRFRQMVPVGVELDGETYQAAWDFPYLLPGALTPIVWRNS